MKKYISTFSPLVAIILAGMALAACGGSLNASSSSTTTSSSTATTFAPTSTSGSTAGSTTTTSAVPPPSTTAVVNYGRQFLTDMAPWNTATAEIKQGDGLTSPAVITAAREAVVSATSLLRQSWPSNAQADIHTFAVELDTINEDVRDNNLSKFDNDVTSLNADANIVRADLGLPSIK